MEGLCRSFRRSLRPPG